MKKKTGVIYKQKKKNAKKKKSLFSKKNFAKISKLFSKNKWLVLLFIAILFIWTADALIPSHTYTNDKKITISPTSTAHNHSMNIQSPADLANNYAADFKEKNFAAIWSLYAPSYQNFIKNKVGENTYLSFLQKKFNKITIANYRVNQCIAGQTIFPYGIERKFHTVCHTYISFALSSSNATISAQLSLFAKTPLVIAKKNNIYKIIGGGPTDLQAPVLFPDTIANNTDAVPVIMYHRIAPMPARSEFNTDYGYRLDVGLTVTPQNFASQMNDLQSKNYHTISPNDLFNNLYYHLPLPPNPILLTFDDGRLSAFTYGLPILLQHHFTATYFIPPYLSGKMFGLDNHNKYMSFAQLQILAEHGMYIENHSLKHDRPLWDIPPAALKQSLTTANSELFQTTKYPIQFIAYPGRWPYANWDQIGPAQLTTEQVLSQMGFATAFLDLGQNEALENSNYPYQVPRIRPGNMLILNLK